MVPKFLQHNDLGYVSQRPLRGYIASHTPGNLKSCLRYNSSETRDLDSQLQGRNSLSQDARLPEPWQRFESTSHPGKLFYLNQVTNESVWEDSVGSSSSRKRPAKTQESDAENCRKTTIRWSNAIKRVVTLKPEELHYSEVNGGSRPFYGPDHKTPNWTPDRGPFTGQGYNWKQCRWNNAYWNSEQKVKSLESEGKVFFQVP